MDEADFKRRLYVARRLAEKAAKNLAVVQSVARATNGVIEIARGIMNVGRGFKSGFEAMNDVSNETVTENPDIIKRTDISKNQP
jgi:hypothetical protein